MDPVLVELAFGLRLLRRVAFTFSGGPAMGEAISLRLLFGRLAAGLFTGVSQIDDVGHFSVSSESGNCARKCS